MSIAPDMPLVRNAAFHLIRSTDNEIIVRFGSRGRSSKRIHDTQQRGILSDIVFASSDTFSRTDIYDRFGNDGAELLVELMENGVVVPKDDLNFSFLTAGYGTAVPEIDTLCVIGEGAFAAECFRLLTDALGERVAISKQPTIKEDAEPAQMTVCVADSPNIGLFYNMNEYALTYGTTWHGGYLDGPEIIVGPLFIPGQTACYHDFDVMEEAGRSMKLDHIYAKMNGAYAKPAQIPTFVASLAASYLTSSVLQHILGVGSHLEGHILRIDLDRLEIIRQRATRLARCPACIENRPDIRSPFL